jgi:CYTH domain-containing protein/CHAD domain-containing protein
VADEVERKFVVSAVPEWLDRCPATRIEQGYLAISEDSEVRLRRRGPDLTLTVKRGHGEVRVEREVAIDSEQFARLWPATEGLRLVKRRHLVELSGDDGLCAEVDVYEGELEGLVVAEIEFDGEEESRGFEPSAWIGAEVTGDERYANQTLAARGVELRSELNIPGPIGKEEEMAKKARTYRLKRREGPIEGVRRIAAGRAGSAVERLREAGEEPTKQIHGARKDLKKLRALLRLVRDDLGRKTFKRENRRYRDAGRLLSPSRDATVRVETLASLEQRFGHEVPAGASVSWRELLEADREAAAAELRGEGAEALERARAAIEVGAAELGELPLGTDSWDLFEPGLTAAYRDGRGALAVVADGGNPDDVHELRKRAKDLWYQLRLFRNAWPGLLGPTAEEVHELTDLLGDHHDLTVLAEDLDARAGLVADRDVLRELIERRQAELLESALRLGKRVYAEKPKRYRKRMRAYWRAWR